MASFSLVETLSAVLQMDNAVRRQAEAHFTKTRDAAPVAVCQELLGVVRGEDQELLQSQRSTEEQLPLRMLAAVLLRRIVDPAGSLWTDAFTEADRIAFRSAVFESWQQEVRAGAQPLLVRFLAHVVSLNTSVGDWPESVAAAVNTVADGSDATALRHALYLLEKISECSGEMVAQQASDLAEFYARQLEAAPSPDIALGAFRAFCHLIIAVADPAAQEGQGGAGVQQAASSLRQYIPNLIGALMNSAPAADEADLLDSLACLSNIAQNAPMFFGDNLLGVCEAMHTLAAGPGEYEFTTRSRALEVILTLAEGAPAQMRRAAGDAVRPVVEYAMYLLTLVDEDDMAWANGSYDLEAMVEDTEEECTIGEEAIERMAASVGGQFVCPVVVEIVQQLTASDSWQQQWAALAALARVADGAPLSFATAVAPAMELCLSVLQSRETVQRLRYQALHCVGRLCGLFPKQLQERFHDKLMPLFIAILPDANGQCPRVRGHACSAMLNFVRVNQGDRQALQQHRERLLQQAQQKKKQQTGRAGAGTGTAAEVGADAAGAGDAEYCPREILDTYVSDALQALCGCLETSPPAVQVAALLTVAAIAQALKTDFSPFYATFITPLKGLIGMAVEDGDTENFQLRARALNVFAWIGDAVGPDIFAADGAEIMEALINTGVLAGTAPGIRDSYFDDVAPSVTHIITAVGEQFAQYLPHVLPALLHAANAEVEFDMTDADKDMEQLTGSSSEAQAVAMGEEEGNIASTVVKVKGVEKRISMNVHAVHEKTQACRVLHDLCDSLGADMNPCIEEVTTAILPLCEFLHDEVRGTAAMAASSFFTAAVGAWQRQERDLQSVQTLLQSCLEGLCTALQQEARLGAQACQSEAIVSILRTVWEAGVERDDGTREASPLVLDMEMAKNIVEMLLQKFVQAMEQRHMAQQEFMQGGAYDESDMDQLEERLNTFEEPLQNFVDAIGHMFKLFGSAFVPYFDERLAGPFADMIRPPQPGAGLIEGDEFGAFMAVCLYDDAIEFAGPGPDGSEKYATRVTPLLVQCAQVAQEVFLRQSSLYGLAQVARHAPGALQSCWDVAIGLLVQVVSAPAAREDENIAATENALNAIGSIVLHLSESDPTTAGQLAALWLAGLPLTTDDTQARAAHRQLSGLLQSQSGLVWFNDQALGNFSIALKAISQIIVRQATEEDANIVDEATLANLVNVVCNISGMAQESPAVQSAWADLNAEQQAAIERVCA